MINFKLNNNRGSLVLPLLVGLGIVAIVLGGLVIGGRRNKEGIFETALEKAEFSKKNSLVEEGGVTIRPIPTSNIIINQTLSLVISSPADGAVFNKNEVVVSGKTLAGVDISVNEKELTTDSNGNFSTTISLEEGENPILVTAGNEEGYVEKEITVSYEK